MHKTWDRIGAMNAARERNHARSGGKTYRPAVARKVDYAPGSWDRLLTVTRATWDCHAGNAVEDYLRAAYPERYEAFL